MPTPPRRRPRIGDTSTRRALTPVPSSSGRIKASTPPRKPTTSRRAAAARASGRLRTRASRPRGQPASERMARPVAPVEKSPSLLQRLASMSVRMKVVLSAAAIVIMAGALSFVFIYFKAVAQLNDEIDKKGARMIDVLRGIPAETWVQFMRMKERDNYFSELIELITLYGPDDWDEVTLRNGTGSLDITVDLSPGEYFVTLHGRSATQTSRTLSLTEVITISPTPVTLTVDGVQVSAQIGAPGETDEYRFTVAT